MNGSIIGTKNIIKPLASSGIFHMNEPYSLQLGGQWPVTLEYIGSTVNNVSSFLTQTLTYQDGDLGIFVQSATQDGSNIPPADPTGAWFGGIAQRLHTNQLNLSGTRLRSMINVKIMTTAENDQPETFNGINVSPNNTTKVFHLFRPSRPIKEIKARILLANTYTGSNIPNLTQEFTPDLEIGETVLVYSNIFRFGGTAVTGSPVYFPFGQPRIGGLPDFSMLPQYNHTQLRTGSNPNLEINSYMLPITSQMDLQRYLYGVSFNGGNNNSGLARFFQIISLSLIT